MSQHSYLILGSLRSVSTRPLHDTHRHKFCNTTIQLQNIFSHKVKSCKEICWFCWEVTYRVAAGCGAWLMRRSWCWEVVRNKQHQSEMMRGRCGCSAVWEFSKHEHLPPPLVAPTGSKQLMLSVTLLRLSPLTADWAAHESLNKFCGVKQLTNERRREESKGGTRGGKKGFI